MSILLRRPRALRDARFHRSSLFPSSVFVSIAALAARFGGARRDRTDDLKLAKLALSQLSYGPDQELQLARQPKLRRKLHQSSFALTSYGGQPPLLRSVGWWARDELNVRPHAYQACALTT